VTTPISPSVSSPDFIYPIDDRSKSKWLWFAAGVGFIILAGIGFVIALFGRVGPFELQLLATLPMLLAVGAFGKAWIARKLPSQIAVDTKGLSIYRGNSIRQLDWDQFGWVTVNRTAFSQQKQLIVFDSTGKKIASISEFPEFDELVDRVQAELARRHGAGTERVRMRKARQTAIFMTGASIFLLAIVAANIWMVRDRQRAENLLKSSAVHGEARILRHFVAPNGVTKRIEYEVSGDNNRTGTRNTEVTPEYWEATAAADKVAVVYVPSEPDISRLAEGEILEKDLSENPLVMYGLCAGLGLLCVLFLAGAALQWKGWDIDFDSKTGTFSIKPFGTGK
jgi:hypothetical protein